MALRTRFYLALLVASGVLASRPARAQLPPLAEVTVQYLPSTRAPDGSGLASQVTSYDGAFNAPLVLGEKTFLIPGFQYHADSISYENTPPGFTPLNLLHGVSVPILLAHVLSEYWTLSFRLWPGAAGDFETFDTGALTLGGLAMASWSPHRRFTLGGGALGSYAFGEFLPLPMLYVDYRPSDWFRAQASLPFFAAAVFSIGDRVELGALVDVAGNQYAIRKASIREAYPCRAAADDPATSVDESVADPSSCVDHLAYSVVSAGAVARVRLVASLWFTGLFGHTLYRRYDLENPDGGAVPGGSVDLPNDVVVRAGFLLRIPERSAPDPR